MYLVLRMVLLDQENLRRIAGEASRKTKFERRALPWPSLVLLHIGHHSLFQRTFMSRSGGTPARS